MGIIMYKNQYLCTTEDLAVEDSYEDQALDTLISEALYPLNATISESLCLTDFYKIIVYVQHLLMEMVLLIPPELLQPDYNHGILEQWAANVTDAQFEEVKIPSKYRLLLRKVDQFVTLVEETPECSAIFFDVIHAQNLPFADLLTSELFRGSAFYDMWKDAFPLVYRATVEELCSTA